ncbi:MAG: type II toxin-antitoxin system MqsA family antitoxin [Thermodesulfobacteriota bacterium]|nr:type II toxin-antitoxin system MqsA family antitoxin [Thermodesulfobacteriota bacterium]
MICDICGQDGTKIRHITRSYGKKTNLFLIENIPVVSCPHCGESYLTAETLYEIERIKLHRKNFAEERSIPVAGFSDISIDQRQDALTKTST